MVMVLVGSAVSVTITLVVGMGLLPQPDRMSVKSRADARMSRKDLFINGVPCK
jgi:hypothetical protein